MNASQKPHNKRFRQQHIQFRPRQATNQTTTPIKETYWGDYLGPKDPTHLRIYLQNPNRISARENFTDFEYLCQNMLANEVDIFCLPETGIDWKQNIPRNRCRQILDNFWAHSRLITSTSKIQSESQLQFGGTCTGITGKWSGRISTQGMDPHGLGRWSYATITGKNGRNILIATIYQACQARIAAVGAKTAYAQQWHILRQQGELNPDPRKSFKKDLDQFLAPHHAAGTEILLMGDFNESIGESIQGINAVINKYGLIDVLPYHHGIDGELETYSRGTKRIDYAFGSQTINESVIRIGYTPYNFVVTSDHRGLFIDLNADVFLGGDPSQLMSPALRGIKSTDPKKCRKYVQEVNKYLTSHHVFDRVIRLEIQTEIRGFTNEIKNGWEKIDRDILRACLHAERLTTGRDRPAWSPKLHQASMIVAFWKIKIAEIKNTRDFTKKLEILMMQIDWTDTPPIASTFVEFCTKLRSAQSKIRAIRKKANSHRSDFLQQRAAAEALAGNQEEAKILRRIEKAEATKECFKLLRKYLKPTVRGGITKVEVEDQPGQTTMITDPDEMVERILKRNQRHFSQATGTPFTREPITDWLGYCGETHEGKRLTQGQSKPDLGNDAVYPETQIMLNALQPFTPPAKPVSIDVSNKDYKTFFKKWDENTSTSPSGKHLGHYKALLSTGLTQDPPLTDTADQIITLQTKMCQLALQHGHVWKRWQDIVSVMIEKKPGVYLLEKLRTIHLFEADYNWTIGLIFGNRMVHNAEQQGHLNNSQWGSRPGRSTEEALIHKIISYEISRTTRTPLGTLDNDAKACYDRIVMLFALILCQKHGVPLSACKLSANALLSAKYAIKTGFGISKDTYSSTSDQPTHGPGQGSRQASALWMVVSCLLFSAMYEHCHGVSFCDPTDELNHRRTSDGFVDDVTHFYNMGLKNSLQNTVEASSIIRGLEREGQTWERLLWTTGGKLELSKCLYYLMLYKFSPDGTPHLQEAEQMEQDHVALTSGVSTDRSKIDHRDSSEAHRTLGIWPTPAGNQDKQFSESLNKSKRFAIGCSKAPMTRYESATAYWTMWLPSITFGFSATTMTYRQLDAIQKPMINAILPKMGYSRKTTREVVFGPTKYVGMGLRHLGSEQGVQQTLLILKQIRANEKLSTLLRIGLSWFQLHAGITQQILECPTIDIPYLEIGWFRSLRQFLCSIQAELHVEPNHIAQHLRRHDSTIMNALLELQNIPPNRLYRINLCRIYLQVENLSEISNTSGTELLQEIWNGYRSNESQTTLLWPHQQRPHEQSWAEWRTALKDAFLAPNIIRANKARAKLTLRQSLGPWIGRRHQRQRKWTHYMSNDAQRLYVRRIRGFYCHDRIPTRSQNQRFQLEKSNMVLTISEVESATPIQCITKTRSLNTSELPNPAIMMDDTTTPFRPSPNTLQQRIQQLEVWQIPLLKHLESIQPEQKLHTMFTQGRTTVFEMASDGGAREDLGSFGWNIAVNQQTLWKCKGPTYGLLPGSFRAESYGMVSALIFIDTYIKQYQTQLDKSTKLQFYCDSESLIKRIFRAQNRKWNNPNDCLASDFDLESGIIEMLNKLPMTIQFIHVKSHQDKDTAVHLLSWDAQMNVYADKLATDYLDNFAEPSKIIPFVRPSKASLTIKGETITRRFANRLREEASGPQLRQCIIDKNKWTERTFASINWEVPGKTLATLENNAKLFIIKFVHGHLPTRKHMQRIGEAETANCPACERTIEDAWHIIACDERQQWRNEFLTTMSDLLHIQQTQPDIKLILLQGLRGAFRNPTFQMSSDNRELKFKYLIDAQNQIGWHQLFKGRFSHHWLQCQQVHIYLDPDTDSLKQSGETWMKRILNCIWTSLWQVWLIRNDDLHGRDRKQREQKRIEKLAPHINALYAKAGFLLAADREIFAIPLDTRLTFPSGELKTWVKLVTPTVKKALSDARESLHSTNQSMLQHTIQRPAPLTVNEQVNELCPISRLSINDKT